MHDREERGQLIIYTDEKEAEESSIEREIYFPRAVIFLHEHFDPLCS